MSDADLVVLGAGLAGTALAARLADAPGRLRRVVVLDPRTDWRDDRTWCWFGPADDGASDLVDRSWSRWRVSTAAGHRGARSVVHDGGGTTAYHRARARTVWDDHLGRIEAGTAVVLRAGTAAGALRALPDGRVEVTTDAGTLRAAAVVDTRPPDRARAMASTLLQVFRGVEVTTERPVFTPGTAGLMERLVADDHGLRFDYVLPTSTTTALVEATRFAPGAVPGAVLAADLEAAVAAASDGARVTRGREEAGVLPMGLPPDPVPPPAGVVRAGTAAGALRPATGYGFRRVLAWADACADAARRTGRPVGHPPDPRHLAAMDAAFLRAVRRDPAAAAGWFVDLADGLSADAWGRFLSERAGAADLLQVVRSLPPRPLVAAALARGRPGHRAAPVRSDRAPSA